MMRVALLVVLTFSVTAFAGAVEPGVVGTWVAPMAGFNLTLKINADGSCTFDDEAGRCTAKGGTLEWRGAEATERYQYTLGGNTLTLSGGDMDMAVAFQRQGNAAPAAPPAVEEAKPPPTAPAKGPGQPFSKDDWDAYSGNSNAGTWRAQGNAGGGTLSLQFGDGSSAQVNYRVSQDPKDRGGYGPGVYFGNDLYQKTGAGDC